MLKVRIAIAATIALASACLSACSPSQATPPDKSTDPASAVPVEVARPTRGLLLATYSGTATLEAEADAEVIARVGGQVRRVLTEEGQRVTAQQLLATLDGEQLRLDVAKAGAALRKAEHDYQRQLELHRKGLIAAGALEALRYDLDTLRATYGLAALQLSYTEIRAPFAGTVAARHIKMGETVQPGAALFRVTDPRPLRAQLFVPERELAHLSRGQSASVQADALAGQMFLARVTLIAPTVDAKSATVKVTVQVDDPRTVLEPGMFARIAIVYERRANALQIPRAAVLESDGLNTVFVADYGRAAQRTVELGLSSGTQVEVTRGLSGAEQVVRSRSAC